MLRAATYVRASTERQTYSTLNQTEALQRYAEAHGHRVVRGYADDGKSGLTLSGRPGLGQLLQDILSGNPGFEVLLVYDVSRWGRFQDADESAHYEFLCRRAGVPIVYCAESFDSADAGLNSVIKAIKRSMAAEYSRDLSTKVIQGRRKLAAQGFALGEAPYGYRRLMVDANRNPKRVLSRGERKALQDHHVVFTPGPPEEISTVRLIFRLFRNPLMGFKAIASYLNQRAVPNGRGNRWTGLIVKRVLTNEVYIGILTEGRMRRRLGARTFVQNDPSEWVRTPNAHIAIVSLPVFRRAQKRIAQGVFKRTDAYYLKPLKTLFKREGYLDIALIRAQPNMPSPEMYTWRFGSLYAAFSRVGWVSKFDPWGVRTGPRKVIPDRGRLLRPLKALLDRTGYLTGKLIDDCPETPSFRVYQWAFGSLTSAYAQIGYSPLCTGRNARKSLLPDRGSNSANVVVSALAKVTN